MSGGSGREYRFEMTLTRAEFLRLLPFAVGPLDLHDQAECIDGRTDDVQWSLRLVERPERRIAGLTLPMLDVTLECAAVDGERIKRFVDRFLLAYRRAGG